MSGSRARLRRERVENTIYRRMRGTNSGAYVVAALVGVGLAEAAALISTIYLHRVLSHKAIELHPAVTFVMSIGTWMLTSISPREWVAVHRKQTSTIGSPSPFT